MGEDNNRLLHAPDMKKGAELDGVKIEGHDFDKGTDYEEILRGYEKIGFQATNFARSVEIINKMIESKAKDIW
ncbi:MAG: deoxyhypusine synthase family protein [archaeon]|nr:deoxyhypusine synthase family protein [archaeon]